MKQFFCKLVTPWLAEPYFDGQDAFYPFLVRYNHRCNTVRSILFVIAEILLVIGYGAVSTMPYYPICVALLVIALALSLIIAQNEKQLPEELRQK